MKYKVANNAIQIHCNSTGGLGEITIDLQPSKPKVTFQKTSYISGVYSESGKANPNPPLCNINSQDSTVLNQIRTISVTSGAEITINANTKYNEIRGY
jgi:hypothetical protein|tara:strand:+ start:841 stop:1134 length:294 start_codon:yes stop_codon:yes gene_type:complete